MNHRGRTAFRTALALIASLALMTGCGSDSDTDGSTTVRIATDNFVLGAPMWIADDKGYFKDEGLKVEPQTYQTGVDGVKAVVAGQADFAPVLDFGALSTLSDKITILGSTAAPQPGFHQLIVNKDIESPSDLNGKTIGFVEGTAEAYVTSKYVEANNLNVKLVALPGLFELVGAMKSGDIDASFLWANGVQEALADSNFVKLTDDSDVIETQAILLVARKDYVEGHADTVKKVLRAYFEATKFAQDDPKAAAAIVARGTGGDAATIEATLPGQNLTMGMTQAQLDHMKDLQSFLVDHGQLQVDGDLMKYFDLMPLREIVGDKVEIR